MAKVVLSKPASYRIGGLQFFKNKAQIVDDQFAREHLDGLQNFTVTYAGDVERMAASGVRTAVRRPADEAARVEQILKAAEALSPNNPAHYTQAGKPQTSALTELLGWPVSAADRDLAFPEAAKDAHVNEPVKKVTTTKETSVDGVKIKVTRREKVTPAGAEKGDLTVADLKKDPKPRPSPIIGQTVPGEPLDTGAAAAQKAADDADDDGGVDV